MWHFNESMLQIKIRCLGALCLCAILALAGCETTKPPPDVPPPPKPAPPKPAPPKEPPAPKEPLTPKPPSAGSAGVLRQADWTQLPGWRDDDPTLAWEPLLTSCRVLSRQEAWRAACVAAESIRNPSREEARRFFELNFTPFQVTQLDGGEEGLVTG